MICVIALVVFGFLGVFSAKYRIIAREAFDCVFRRITFRKCTTGLDTRLKAQITGKLMSRHPSFGRALYRNFEVVSWFFTILLLVSLFFSARSVYNFAVYGNCNGPNNDEFCIFDPLNSLRSDSAGVCSLPGHPEGKNLSFAGSVDGRPFLGAMNASIIIVEYGCFSCPNTKTAVPEVNKVIGEYGDRVKLVFLSFPLPGHELSFETSLAAECVWMNDPGKYWDYHFALFDRQEDLSVGLIRELAVTSGVDIEKFDECISSGSSRFFVDSDYQSGIDSNIYGTPTFFVNNESFVGSVGLKEIEDLISKGKI